MNKTKKLYCWNHSIAQRKLKNNTYIHASTGNIRRISGSKSIFNKEYEISSNLTKDENKHFYKTYYLFNERLTGSKKEIVDCLKRSNVEEQIINEIFENENYYDCFNTRNGEDKHKKYIDDINNSRKVVITSKFSLEELDHVIKVYKSNPKIKKEKKRKGGKPKSLTKRINQIKDPDNIQYLKYINVDCMMQDGSGAEFIYGNTRSKSKKQIVDHEYITPQILEEYNLDETFEVPPIAASSYLRYKQAVNLLNEQGFNSGKNNVLLDLYKEGHTKTPKLRVKKQIKIKNRKSSLDDVLNNSLVSPRK